MMHPCVHAQYHLSERIEDDDYDDDDIEYDNNDYDDDADDDDDEPLPICSRSR